MEYTIHTTSVEKSKSDCLVVGVFEQHKLSSAAHQLDKITGGYLSRILKAGEMSGKMCQTLWLRDIPHSKIKRVLLVGCGEQQTLTHYQYSKIINSMISALHLSNLKTATCFLTELEVKERNMMEKIQQIILTNGQAIYRFNQLKSKNKQTPPPELKQLALYIDDDTNKNQAKKVMEQAHAITTGMHLCKNLSNLPANICTPTYLAKEAERLAKQFKTIKTTVLNEKAMEKLGMHSLLSVTHGSHEPAKLICVEYRGTHASKKPVALVGKGITFDSGGISLKGGAGMDEMKFDMCGAASVLGTIHAAAQLQLPINVVGVIAATENLPGGSATKPGDIVKSLSGQTIEILNTDAEGRLVLCDALTYCKKYQPEVVIDIATLTGAIVVSLSNHASGLFTSDDALAEDLFNAGKQTYDRAWRMPLYEEQQEVLESNFADMANIADRPGGGSMTAACFLSRFTKNYRWAHLDIAGVAWNSGKAKGATGRPVPLLTQFLINRCKTK